MEQKMMIELKKCIFKALKVDRMNYIYQILKILSTFQIARHFPTASYEPEENSRKVFFLHSYENSFLLLPFVTFLHHTTPDFITIPLICEKAFKYTKYKILLFQDIFHILNVNAIFGFQQKYKRNIYYTTSYTCSHCTVCLKLNFWFQC